LIPSRLLKNSRANGIEDRLIAELAGERDLQLAVEPQGGLGDAPAAEQPAFRPTAHVATSSFGRRIRL
jgi:hypothetical protein